MLNAAKDGCQMDRVIRQVEPSEPKLSRAVYLAHNQDSQIEDGDILDSIGTYLHYRKANVYTQRTILMLTVCSEGLMELCFTEVSTLSQMLLL